MNELKRAEGSPQEWPSSYLALKRAVPVDCPSRDPQGAAQLRSEEAVSTPWGRHDMWCRVSTLR